LSNNNANIVNTSGAAINNNTTTTTTNSSYIGANLTNTFYPNDHQSFHEKFLLPPVRPSDLGKKCLIIDLDETLVHSSFKQVHNADFIVPVEIDGIVHQVYVLKRPHVDEFLKRMGEIYECVLFTASLAKYADPVADLLDKWGVFRARLFREACVYYRGNYVKDLSRLGRDLNKVLILDNSPASYIFHPDNAVACQSWFDDAHDTELRDLIPYFERLAHVDSVYTILKQQKLAAAAAAAAAGQHHHHQHQSLSHLIAAACGGSFVTSLANDSSANEADSVVPGSSQPPSPNAVIYQMQAPPTSPPPVANLQSTPSTINNLNYLINENKMLLSIDMMMAKQQQQQQISKHHK